MHRVTRQQWGMPPLLDNHETRNLSVITEANVHHSDSETPDDHDLCAGIVLGFDHDHRSQGWAGIGYNRIICGHGYVFYGRPREVTPAAAMDHNTPIIAYCIIAGGNEHANREQIAALKEIVARDENVVGHPLKWTTHREVWPHTLCPGDGIQHQVESLRRHA